MKIKIGIIDYGMGNIHSVKNAFDFLDCDTFVSDDVSQLNAADGLILPGVGAFPDAMKQLKLKQLDRYIQKTVNCKPLLGICLGMQLLFDYGYEFAKCQGLGLISGDVVKMDNTNVKIPHIGWNQLKLLNKSKLTIGTQNDDQVYFVHSYKAIVRNRQNLIAVTDYGAEITAIVENGNVYGCQFHPEKSQTVGLKILDNFRRIVDDNNSCN